MPSDFELLSEKIQRLADLNEKLRTENVELRRKVDELNTDKAALNGRMQQAAQRVNALMEKLSDSKPKENAS